MDKNDITQRLVLAAGATDDEKLQALLIEAADAIEHLRELLPPFRDEALH